MERVGSIQDEFRVHKVLQVAVSTFVFLASANLARIPFSMNERLRRPRGVTFTVPCREGKEVLHA